MFDKVEPLTEGVVPTSNVDGVEQRPPTKADLVPLDEFTTQELMVLRDRLEQRLPSSEMDDMDLSKELVVQYHRIKALQTEAMNDKYEQLQKKSSVANACLSSLNALVRMQVELHTAERFKAIEALMVKYVKMLPKHVAEQFLSAYERLDDFKGEQ